MKSPVIIKGNKYGFQIVLNPDLSFEELLQEVSVKFRESSGFFDRQRPMAIRFDGRDLTEEEQNALVDAITANCDLRIGYLIDGARDEEKTFARVIKERELIKSPALKELTAEEETNPEELPSEPQELFHSEQPTEKNGQFYRGTLRSGQSIEVDGSIVILGDINPGAQVTAGGNVVVLGSLKGIITAGYPSDQSALVAALSMDPMQIKIGNIIARAPDQKASKKKRRLRRKKEDPMEPKIAFVENNSIFIEPITRALINEFSSM